MSIFHGKNNKVVKVFFGIIVALVMISMVLLYTPIFL